MQLTKKQNRVFQELTRNLANDQVQTLGGFAGTGKSTLLGFLAHALPDFAVCAFTGKAANVLRRRGLAAGTIHSTIYHPVHFEDGHVSWQLRQEIDFHGFLVDEASMVSMQIDMDLQSFGLPIIYIGDHGQLPPVGRDAGIMVDPMYRLETIHRNAGPIAHFAEHLRQGKPANRFDGLSKVQILTKRNVRKEILSDVNQIICAFNVTRVHMNREIRRFLGYKGPLRPSPRRTVCCSTPWTVRAATLRQLGPLRLSGGLDFARPRARIVITPAHPPVGQVRRHDSLSVSKLQGLAQSQRLVGWPQVRLSQVWPAV